MVLILPLRAVLLQSLFLLVTIAIEAVILRWELRMPYKRSVQYAATLNLLSMVIGWLSFFLTLPILEVRLLEDVISYVLFDRLPIHMPLIVVGGFIAFMLSFLVKLYGLKGLDFILERQGPKPVEDAPPPNAPVALSPPQPPATGRAIAPKRPSPAPATLSSWPMPPAIPRSQQF